MMADSRATQTANAPGTGRQGHPAMSGSATSSTPMMSQE